MKNVWVISDIHGCIRHFEKALEQINLTKDDILILLGDYIDRGEDSYLVVKKIQELQKEFNVIALKGNHEDLLIHAYEEKLNSELGLYNKGKIDSYGWQRDWHSNGGYTTEEDYARHGANIAEDIDWFKSLPYYVESEDYIFVHAGLKPKVELEKQSAFDLIWIRDEFINSTHDFGKTVVFGHTPVRSLTITDGGNIGVDTGCCYTGKLTVLELSGYDFFEVKLPLLKEVV